MYFGNIKNCDIANGIGVRVTLFVSGCTNHCKNCFQPETWDFCYGKEFTQEEEDKLIEMLKPSYINGLTLLGGEPMEPKNQPGILKLIERVRKELPEKNIWCYSGFTFERLMTPGEYPHTEITEKILRQIDVLVDGRFVEELKSLTLRFRGSSNQRLIDLKKTFYNGGTDVILLPLEDRHL